MKRVDIFKLNQVLSNGVKVGKLEKDVMIEFLTLKISIGDEHEDIKKNIEKFKKEAMSQFGITEEDNGSKEDNEKANDIFNTLLEKYLQEDIEDIKSNILSPDDIYNAIIDLDENKSIAIEDKAVILKYLKK